MKRAFLLLGLVVVLVGGAIWSGVSGQTIEFLTTTLNQTVTATHTFNPGGPPFIVGANANGLEVAGFRAATATALSANPANCGAGQVAAGVDATGVAEGCVNASGSGDITDVGNCATGACFQATPANQVLAAPDGVAGVVAPRAVVDADIPNTITVDLATTATTATLGDSATAFFSVGTLEDARLSANVSLLGQTISDAEVDNTITLDNLTQVTTRAITDTTGDLPLITRTSGNFVASVATTAPVTGGAVGSEGAVLTVACATCTTNAAALTVDQVVVGNGGQAAKTLAAGAAGNVLTMSSGIPTWAAAGGGTTHNILSATHTDSLAATVVLGDMIHGNATPAWARLAGNITTAKQFLSQTGTGTVSAAPIWTQPAFADLSGAATDAQIPDTITLTNLTQVTTRAIADTTGILVLARGGSGADLSATGGANQFVKQSTAGGAFTVGTIADADVPNTIILDNITQISTRTHASLTGLTVDDHTQYLLTSGGRALTGTWTSGNQFINLGTTGGGIRWGTTTGDVPIDIRDTQSTNNAHAYLRISGKATTDNNVGINSFMGINTPTTTGDDVNIDEFFHFVNCDVRQKIPSTSESACFVGFNYTRAGGRVWGADMHALDVAGDATPANLMVGVQATINKNIAGGGSSWAVLASSEGTQTATTGLRVNGATGVGFNTVLETDGNAMRVDGITLFNAGDETASNQHNEAFQVINNANTKVMVRIRRDGGVAVGTFTTTERDAMQSVPTGCIIFNTTTGTFQGWTGSAWVALS